MWPQFQSRRAPDRLPFDRIAIMINAMKILVLLPLAVALAIGPATAQDCAAKCRAQEMQCLQQSKGDTAKCNAMTTQCYQSCIKQK